MTLRKKYMDLQRKKLRRFYQKRLALYMDELCDEHVYTHMYTCIHVYVYYKYINMYMHIYMNFLFSKNIYKTSSS